ncbi:DNA translocase FtsK, partial [Streptomyces sp. t39]|uniref:DNA translocase FtsK n=1 Tax=Streptomyces sp. t39 TaxID=1828156 RepID=UPI0012C858B5
LDTYIQRGKQYQQTGKPTATPIPEPDPAEVAAFLDQVEGLTRQAVVNLDKPTKKDARHPRRDEVCAWVQQAGADGITVADVRDRLTRQYPGEKPPSDTAIQNWYADHPNITKPRRGTYVWINETPNTQDPTTTDPAAAVSDEVKELLPAAIELLVSTQFGSASMLQRKLRITWDLTNQILNTLENAGIVGPADGSKARDVLIRNDQLDEILQQYRHLRPQPRRTARGDPH